MPKQVSNVCFSLFIVLSLLVNCSVAADSSQQTAPTASESADPAGANITDIVTGSNETLTGENASAVSNSNVTTDVQTNGAQNVLDQQLASPSSVNANSTVPTKGDNNITSPAPSIVGNSVLDTRDADSVSQENNTQVPLSNADPPASATNIVQENTSLPPTVETKGDNNTLASPPSIVDNSMYMDSVSQENNTQVPLSNADPPAAATNIVQENTSLPPTVETKGDNNTLASPPSVVDNSILDTRDMDGVSQENNTQVPLSNADPPAAETKESSIGDLVQDNTSLPPTVETKEEGNNVSQETTLVPPSISPAYIDTPAFETTDGGSFTQENQSPPPSNMVSENVPEFNDYNSPRNNVVPAPSEALSYPGLDPTFQSTDSNDDTYNSAPTSNQHTILPFNYRAEDEPVEPYEEVEDSWNRANGAVAGVLVGAGVIGVGGFLYQKRKKDNVRAQQYQYQCLGKKEGV